MTTGVGEGGGGGGGGGGLHGGAAPMRVRVPWVCMTKQRTEHVQSDTMAGGCMSGRGLTWVADRPDHNRRPAFAEGGTGSGVAMALLTLRITASADPDGCGARGEDGDVRPAADVAQDS